MTDKQKHQFNKMRNAPLKISKTYMTIEQMRKKSESYYGLDFEECLEMSYDNMQMEAKNAVKNVKELKFTPIDDREQPSESD